VLGVFTCSFDKHEEAKHLYCELGGEWIGNGHVHMKDLCKEFKLEPLMRHCFDFSFLEGGKIKDEDRFTAGAVPFSGKSKEAFNLLREEAKNWSPRTQEILDRKDWWTILRDRGFTDDELLRRDLMDSTDFGETIRQVGGFSAAAEYFTSNKNDEMDFRVAGSSGRFGSKMIRVRVRVGTVQIQKDASQGGRPETVTYTPSWS
jgi:monoamine oxidase